MLLAKTTADEILLRLESWQICVPPPSINDAYSLFDWFNNVLQRHVEQGYQTSVSLSVSAGLTLAITIEQYGLSVSFRDLTGQNHCPSTMITWTNFCEFGSSYLQAFENTFGWELALMTASILDRASDLDARETSKKPLVQKHIIAAPRSAELRTGDGRQLDLSNMHALHYRRETIETTDCLKIADGQCIIERDGDVIGFHLPGQAEQFKMKGILLDTVASDDACIWHKDGFAYLPNGASSVSVQEPMPVPKRVGLSHPFLLTLDQDNVGRLSNLELNLEMSALDYGQLGLPWLHETAGRSLLQILDSGLILEFSSDLRLLSVRRCPGAIDALINADQNRRYLCARTQPHSVKLLSFCRLSGAVSLEHHIHGTYVDFTQGQDGQSFFLFEASDGVTILESGVSPELPQRLTRIDGVSRATSITYLGSKLLIVGDETHWIWDIQSGQCQAEWTTSGHSGSCNPLRTAGLIFTVGYALEVRSEATYRLVCRLELDLGEPDAWFINPDGDLFLSYGKDLMEIRRRGYIGLTSEC